MAETQQEPVAGYAVRNPRTGELLYEVTEPSLEEVDQVYARAERAFETLRRMTVRERMEELTKFQRWLLEHKETVARRIVEETGKSLMDAMALDIFPVCDAIAYYRRHAERILADRRVPTPLLLMGKKSKVCYEPMGPVLIVSPWNYPFNLSMTPFVCAFAAGNPVILKPSKQTPLRGVVEDILEGCRFLEGGLQVVYASRRTAGRLIEKRPAKIHFTGSVEVGRAIMAQAAPQLIPVELELGGKDPCIIFADANLKRAVEGVIWGAFCNCGQTCTSIERVFVQEGVYEEFVRRLREKTARIVTLAQPEGQASEMSLTMGCMTAGFQVEEIRRQLADAREKGAVVLEGGEWAEGSHVLPPTIVANVNNTMAVHMEETFGPVITVTPFHTEEEAVRLANDSPYGLSSSVWSGDLARAERVARQLVTGSVSINNVMATHGNQALPFGGIKDSGFGRYRGEEGLHAFSNIKAMLIDRNSRWTEAYWYPYSEKKYRMMTRLMDSLFRDGWVAWMRSVFRGLRFLLFAQRHRP